MAHRSFYPFAKPLNEQLQTLKGRMQAHLPCIDRVSFAKYHTDQDVLKSFAESEFDTWCLAHHESAFRKLHHLNIASKNAVPRIVEDLHDIKHCPRVQILLKHGYQSSAAIPCYDNKAFTGFVFLNSTQRDAFSLEALNGLKPYFEMIRFAVESETQVVNAIETLANRMQCMMPGYSPEYYAHTKRMKYYSQIIATQLADRYSLNFFASFSAFSWSTLRCRSSIKDRTSPIPRIREATRSGWNGSSASVFSPTPKNLIGLPVTWRTDSAAPPRASPSTLVRTTPVRGSASPKAFAVFAAS